MLIHSVFSSFAVHSQSIQLAGKPNGEIRNINHLLNLALALGKDFAHFKRDKPAQALFIFTKFIANLPDDLSSFGSRYHSPGSKSLGCPIYNFTVIAFIGLNNTGNFFFRSGIYRNKFFPTGFFNPSSCICARIDLFNP